LLPLLRLLPPHASSSSSPLKSQKLREAHQAKKANDDDDRDDHPPHRVGFCELPAPAGRDGRRAMHPTVVYVRRRQRQDDEPQSRREEGAEGAGQPLGTEPTQNAIGDLAGREAVGGTGRILGGEFEFRRAKLAPAVAVGHLEPRR